MRCISLVESSVAIVNQDESYPCGSTHPRRNAMYYQVDQSSYTRFVLSWAVVQSMLIVGWDNLGLSSMFDQMNCFT